MKKNNRKFSLTVLAAILANAFLVFLLVFLFKASLSGQEDVRSFQAQSKTYENSVNNVKQIREDLLEKERGSFDLAQVFLDKESLVNFIERLEYSASKAGAFLEMRGVTFSEGEKKPTFTFFLRGPFASLQHFFILLESDVYQVFFQKVYLQKPEKGKVWEANLELKLISFK